MEREVRNSRGCILMEHNLDQSVGASIVFTSPKGHIASYSCRLEFDTTNNMVEYEALLLGLELTREMGIKVLVVIGDFDLVVKQVKNEFSMKNNRLK
jgi:ribonuclease HI